MRWCTVDGSTVSAFAAGVPGVFITPESELDDPLELEDEELLEPEDEGASDEDEEPLPDELPEGPSGVVASVPSPPELDVPPESRPDELVPELDPPDGPPDDPPEFDAPQPATAAAIPRTQQLCKRSGMMHLSRTRAGTGSHRCRTSRGCAHL
jgi:hypothetical protein